MNTALSCLGESRVMGDTTDTLGAYPEAARHMKERRARNPRDDAFDSYESWAASGRPVFAAGERRSSPPTEQLAKVRPEEERQKQHQAHLRAKALTTRRSIGGRLCAHNSLEPELALRLGGVSLQLLTATARTTRATDVAPQRATDVAPSPTFVTCRPLPLFTSQIPSAARASGARAIRSSDARNPACS